MSRRALARRTGGAHYDYAARQRSRSSAPKIKRTQPKSRIHKKKNTVSGTPVWLKIATVLLLASLLLGGIVWYLSPIFLSLKSSQQIVFLSPQKDGVNNQIAYAIFSPEQQKITIWQVPASAPVPVLGGYGNYPLAAINRLLAIDGKEHVFRRAAMSQSLGVVANDVVEAPVFPTQFQTKDDITKWWWESMTKQPMSARMWLRWYWFAKNVPINNISIKTLNSIDELRQTVSTLPDWSDDGCSVAIVNSTAQAGLASQFSRALETSQLRVIRVTDTNQPQEKTTIIMAESNEACQRAQASLESITPVSVIIENNLQKANQYRADVVLVLGTDAQKAAQGT